MELVFVIDLGAAIIIDMVITDAMVVAVTMVTTVIIIDVVANFILIFV